MKRLLFAVLVAAISLTSIGPAQASQTPLRAADPSVIHVGSTYISVQSTGAGIAVRQATSTDALAWAPGRSGRTPVAAVRSGLPNWSQTVAASTSTSRPVGANHRVFVISSASPDSGYTAETQLALPDDRWAIDGTMFTFSGQRWFVWSGWAGDTNVEQNLYIARMSNPTTPTGARYIVSQPRESWERVVGNPFINEGPEAIKDPNGQLHIVYSANGSWRDQYCLADLRLRSGGDPTYVWDW
ncbi:family 43 glycosylhydrolase [Streptomyces sp. CB01373]|uniref:family 43 glycosylhydrolase n=1 Tax=Streptomyces sp. CB01373 TaxID=2020325 RepID=UPI00131E25AC|nr:family 43 glycosylhydrolase [Streptomyces sp. CB01373]